MTHLSEHSRPPFGLASVERLLTRATDWLPPADRRLAVAAALMVAVLLPIALIASVDTRTFAGVSAWLKPAKFALSLGLHLGTLAFVVGALSPAARRRWTVSAMSMTVIATSFFEFLYIAYRGARGEASHFNVADPIASTMFNLMGLAAVLLVLATAGIGVAVARDRDARLTPAVKWAVVAGLLVAGIGGLVTGVAISANNGYLVGLPPASHATLPVLGWSLAVGDLRVAHFIALHAMQVIPLVALVALATGRDQASARRTAMIAAVAWTGLAVAALAGALAGWPLTVSALSG
jgi:hypothetical protein